MRTETSQLTTHQRPANDDPVTQVIHGPHLERFESNEEDWLLGNGPIRPPSIQSIVADYRQGNSDKVGSMLALRCSLFVLIIDAYESVDLLMMSHDFDPIFVLR